jgi:sensor c-di-GMP phosphodiesterase-like protein
MYRSKAAGPSGITYFEEGMNRDAQRRLLIEQRLRVALRDGDLSLEYQAKINLNDGSLAGFEALARWNDSQLGVVSPIEFIAVAGVRPDQLRLWVLNEACSTYQHLRTRHRSQTTERGVSVRRLRDDPVS